jgi:hypothetical protein
MTFHENASVFPVNIISPLLHIQSYIILWMDEGPVRGPVPQTMSYAIATETTITRSPIT